MNYLKKGLIIILMAFVFNILETWFFGWNHLAQSTTEAYCDMIASIGISIGLAYIAGHVIGSTAVIRMGEEDDIEEPLHRTLAKR